MIIAIVSGFIILALMIVIRRAFIGVKKCIETN